MSAHGPPLRSYYVLLIAVLGGRLWSLVGWWHSSEWPQTYTHINISWLNSVDYKKARQKAKIRCNVEKKKTWQREAEEWGIDSGIRCD